MRIRGFLALAVAVAACTTAPADAAYTGSLLGLGPDPDGDAADDSIEIDQSGGLLKHSTFAAFNSDFDFDSATPGGPNGVGERRV